MGWCIDFELIESDGIKAKYRYGKCLHDLDGIVEVDVIRVINGEIPGETPMSEVAKVITPCEGENDSQRYAILVFSAIHRYYRKNGVYPEKGAYYS